MRFIAVLRNLTADETLAGNWLCSVDLYDSVAAGQALGGEGSLAHVDSLSQRVALKIETNESRRQRNRVLVAEIKDLKNGLDAVEELARSEFGLIRDGETFFLIVDE